MTARKDDTDKPTPQFLPPHAMYDLGYVAQAGAKKYGDWNYLSNGGLKASRLVGAALRHTYRWMSGQDKDEEGLHHLLCAAWSLLALYETVHLYPENDDRMSTALEDEADSQDLDEARSDAENDEPPIPLEELVKSIRATTEALRGKK